MGTERALRQSLTVSKLVILSFVSIVAITLILCVGSKAYSDVSPGDVIDKTNYEKIEGLVPDRMLAWVKDGKYVLNVGELNYDPAESISPFAREAMEKNVGKYDINNEGTIVESGSGNQARAIIGHPFPKIDMGDPEAARKLLYDALYSRLLQGSVRFAAMRAYYMGASSVERELSLLFKVFAFTGYPGAKDIDNPQKYEQLGIFKVTDPYDIAGTAILFWRFFGEKKDVSYGYLPGIRRVRRMTPANRSDSIFGTDYSIDDAGYSSYDGKIPYFDWKILAEKEALGMYLGPNQVALTHNEDGEWSASTETNPIRFGFETEGWTGSIWAPTNVIVVKRPVYLVQGIAKDPYYNYGPQTLWIDKEFYCGYYKEISDRAGKEWKMLHNVWTGAISADDTNRIVLYPSGTMVDERYNHTTVWDFYYSQSPWVTMARDNINDYSLGGFVRFCK